MIIKEITEEELNNYVFSHPLKNYFQTSYYANFMKKYGYEVFYIGAFKNNIQVGASVILSKYIIPTVKYGYAPRGFILDYYNDEELKEFTICIKNFFYKKMFAFIKLNPEITYAAINSNNNKIINNSNVSITNNLRKLGYRKLKEDIKFVSSLPKINAIINTDNYNFDELKSKYKEIIDIANDYNITLKKVDKTYIRKMYDYFDNKNVSAIYYEDFYNSFNKKNMIDAVIIRLDLRDYLKKLQMSYDEENEKNSIINEQFSRNPNDEEYYNIKINSDKTLENIKSNIIKITNLLKNDSNGEIILGVAFLIKMDKRISLVYYGDNKNYSKLKPRECLLYKIIELYKNEYKFFDLGGLTIDYLNNNVDNNLKLSLNPSLFEYIGEYDLEINKLLLQVLLNSNKLKNEFSNND